MRDDRQNLVSDAGRRTESRVLDQREKVTEFGRLPSSSGARASAGWSAAAAATTGCGSICTIASSPTATTAAPGPCRPLSGNFGLSWLFGDQFVPYVNVSTAFETPTTTELVNKPDGSGGLNPDLGPSAR